MENNPIRISVIIVNYNVEYFLEQCLNSVFDALQNCSGEVFVVDNNSIDGSVEMVQKKFPQVRLIANKENTGFSKANNQAMRQAEGDYILLLNPDTVVEEDTFQKCIDFMDKHPDGGGLGVHMIDGKGKFLPESKRGLPTPAVAFYKIFGFSRLFPKSKRFGKYHLGFLPEFETNEIEILSGAYMFMRKETLDKVGLLDEAFFMYGEDIDLSYRITEGGYKNYYFPETQIIHYKGESTKKGSVNYVFVFYRAMVIFAKKHFSQKNARLFSFFINLAIYFRASLAILNRFIRKIALPAVDFILVLIALLLTTKLWSIQGINLPNEVLFYAVPSYTFTWLCANFYSGSYDFPLQLKSFFKGTFIGTLLILIIYALLPKAVQFSRLFILLGAIVVLFYFSVSRFILHLFRPKKFNLKGIVRKNFAIIGEPDEVKRVKEIIKNTPHKVNAIYSVAPTNDKRKDDCGSLNQLDQIVSIYAIDEIIFCAKNTTAEKIIKWMGYISQPDIEFKIAQPNSMYLIGSNSIDTAGDFYALEIDNISSKSSKRNKRTFDFLSSLLLLVLSPIILWFYSSKNQFLSNCWAVLIGRKSWIGYTANNKSSIQHLPKIKAGIFPPSQQQFLHTNPASISKINLIYARDYSVVKDIVLLWKNRIKFDK